MAAGRLFLVYKRVIDSLASVEPCGNNKERISTGTVATVMVEVQLAYERYCAVISTFIIRSVPFSPTPPSSNKHEHAFPLLINLDAHGRAETTRLTFAYGNVAFEDKRIAHAEWPTDSMPLGHVPILEVNDKLYSQSGAYPTDTVKALAVNMVLDTLNN